MFTLLPTLLWKVTVKDTFAQAVKRVLTALANNLVSPVLHFPLLTLKVILAHCDITFLFFLALTVLRNCGHVHCSECVDMLIRPALKKAESDKAERPACLECGKTIKSALKDLVAILREGTGFTSAGGNETKKKGISFQG